MFVLYNLQKFFFLYIVDLNPQVYFELTVYKNKPLFFTKKTFFLQKTGKNQEVCKNGFLDTIVQKKVLDGVFCLMYRPRSIKCWHVTYFRLRIIPSIEKSYWFRKNHHKSKKCCQPAAGPFKSQHSKHFFSIFLTFSKKKIQTFSGWYSRSKT